MQLSFNFPVLSIAMAATLSFAGAASAQEITGAGATFPAPIYAKWASDYYKATGVKVNYQSIGSGGGIKQIDSKTVDFGASDMPQTDEVLKTKGQMQFPTVMGGVVPVINVKGIEPGQLKLNGQVLADIFLGKISRWNDPALKALNPTLPLPDAAIAQVRRADGSGTTFIFTNYLSKVSGEWKSKVGEGTAVNWPVGAGGKGNEGVASYVQRIKGGIGYVEYAYAKKNKMTHLSLKNKAGEFVQPDDLTFQAAAAYAEWSKVPGFGEILTEQPGKTSWPITGASFVLMHKVQADPAKGAEVLKFFDWAFKNGQKLAEELDYVALPPALVKQIDTAWRSSLKDAAGNPVLK